MKTSFFTWLLWLLISVLLFIREASSSHHITAPADRSHLTVLVFAFGTRGDIQPVLELCRILKSSGHDCIVAANDRFGDLIAQNGFESIGMLCSEESMLKHLEIYAEHGMSSLHANMQMTGMINFIDDLARGANDVVTTFVKLHGATSHRVDLVMAPNWMQFGSNVAEYLKVPFIEYQIFPTTKTRDFAFFASEDAYRPLQSWLPILSGTFNKLSYRIAQLGTSVASLKQMNTRRTELGLPHLDVFEWAKRLKSVPVLYAFSPLVRPKPADWSSHVHVVGFWIPPASGHLDWAPPADLLRFFDASDRPIVYFDLGSMMMFERPQQKAVKILNSIKSTVYRWIISVTTPDGDLYPFVQDLCKDELLKDSLFLKKEAIPHTWLIPKVDVYIHHGGAGSCASAFYSGVPSIVFPVMGDQFQNCDNVERLKVGLCLKGSDGSAIQVEDHVKSVFENRLFKFKAQKLRDGLLQENVAENTMRAINSELDFILSSGNNFPGQYKKN